MNDAEPGPVEPGTADPLAAEAVGHLRAAATELISAGRAFLDLLEDVVNDDGAAGAAVEAFDALAVAARRARRAATGYRAPTHGDGGTTGGEPPPGVQHIRIS